MHDQERGEVEVANTQLRALRERLDAFAAGYESGRRAEPLFGVDWASLWALPLAEVRARLGLLDQRIVGEGIRAAA